MQRDEEVDRRREDFEELFFELFHAGAFEGGAVLENLWAGAKVSRFCCAGLSAFRPTDWGLPI